MKSDHRWATQSLGIKSRQQPQTDSNLGCTSIWLLHEGRQDFLKWVSQVLQVPEG